MKTDYKDFIFSTIAITIILTTSISGTVLASLIFPSIPDKLFLLIYVPLFLFSYGTATSVYLKIVNRFLPFQSGSYLMNNIQFTLWKHHAVVGEFGKLALKPFSPLFLKPLYFIMFGAKIGKGVAIGGTISDPILTTIEDFAILGQGSILVSHSMTLNYFFLKPVVIGKRATIGIKAVIMPGVEVGENSIIAPGSIVSMDTKIPPNEFWEGIPAKKIRDIRFIK